MMFWNHLQSKKFHHLKIQSLSFVIHFYDRTMTGSLDCVLEVAPTAATTPPGSSTPPTLTATKVDGCCFEICLIKKNLELSLPAMTD